MTSGHRVKSYEDQAQRFCSWVHFKPGCWEWLGGRIPNGYGLGYFLSKRQGAHRIAYEIFVGPIPDGLQIDHLCRNRGCVNPAHLEAVTCQENLRRGINARSARTHCPQGHPYDETNTVIEIRNERPTRDCRICRQARWQRTRTKRKVSA